MEPEQQSGGALRRTQYPAFRWHGYGHSRQGRTASGEPFRRERYQSPCPLSTGPLMHSLAAAVEYEIAKLQANSIIRQGRTRVRRKRNKCRLRRQREKANARQIFVAVEHSEIIQIQPGQSGIEVSPADESEIARPSSQGGAVIVRTGKTEYAALRHQPCPVGRAVANGNRQTCRMGDQVRSSYATSEVGAQSFS